MAIYHLSMQIVGRSKGQNVVAMAAYRSGQKLVDEKTNEAKSYRRHVQPETFILAPDHAPEWVYDRQRLWNEVERVERRGDAQLAREMNIALPIELSRDQQRELVIEFVQDQFVNRGMIADVAIHRDDLNNPHFHVLLTMRDITPEGFGLKNRSWNPSFANRGKKYDFEGRGFVKDTSMCVDIRSAWAHYANRALERAGFEERIDHRSYKDQGIDKIPAKHLGAAHSIEKLSQKKAEEKGLTYQPVTDLGRINQEIEQINREAKRQESNVISLREAVDKKKSDLRHQLKESGLWDRLEPAEKAAIQFVQKRMKESATLPLAIECRASLERFSVSIERKENKIEGTKQQLQEAKELYMSYLKSEEGTIERDRLQLALARKGFTVEHFREELTQQVEQLKSELQRIPQQKAFLAEGMEKVNRAIETLERFTWEEMRLVYGSQVNQLRYLPAEDAYRLLDEFRSTGRVIPVDQVESYLSERKARSEPAPPSLLQLHEKYTKDNRFLVNWKRKLDRLEKEATERINVDPKTAAAQLKQISQERGILAERMKKLKTAMHVLDKTMRAELKKLYPDHDLSSLDMKVVRKILKLNEVEGRVVNLDEIQQYQQPATKRTTDSHYEEHRPASYSLEGAAIIDEISHSIEAFFRDQKSQENDIHRAIEREKWRRIKRDMER